MGLCGLNTASTRDDAAWSGSVGVFRDGGAGPEMAAIPAGGFWMGSPETEPDRSSNEGPQRWVTIGRPFAAGRLPVTFDDWDAAIRDGWRHDHKPSDHGWGRGRRPVIDVNWYDAKAYVRWLSEKTGQDYRLLSEAEWEYAARAGGSEAYATGAGVTATQARFSDGARFDGPAEAGSFAPNDFGLYDMHGNVWEWVEDCYSGDYSGTFPLALDGRAARGGSWGVDRRWLRSACRGWLAPTLRNDDVGFRVARSL
jgi:formylglycine-generating enzyme required for sulfatase activity